MKTVRATKFGKSPRGNNWFRVPSCGCKVEILPAKTGDGADVHYCDIHGEAPLLLEVLERVIAHADRVLGLRITNEWRPVQDARVIIARAKGGA